MAAPNAPVKKIRIGQITVNIWEQNTANGKLYNSSFQRSWYNERTKLWETSDSFGLEGISVLSTLCTLASGWIARQMEADYQAKQAAKGNNNGGHDHSGNAGTVVENHPAMGGNDGGGGARGGNRNGSTQRMRDSEGAGYNIPDPNAPY